VNRKTAASKSFSTKGPNNWRNTTLAGNRQGVFFCRLRAPQTCNAGKLGELPSIQASTRTDAALTATPNSKPKLTQFVI
jgi:hypothetical protein